MQLNLVELRTNEKSYVCVCDVFAGCIRGCVGDMRNVHDKKPQPVDFQRERKDTLYLQYDGHNSYISNIA